MNLQQQSLHNSLTPFSTVSVESVGKRRPRFQRQKSNNKCDCTSTSKNKSSCDSFSLSHFYVKQSFAKPSTPSKNGLNGRNPESQINTQMDLGHSDKKNLDSTRIQNKNDSQHLSKSQIHKIDESQILVQGFLMNYDSLDENKKQTEALLKKTIFYKEKCLKYEQTIKEIRIEKSSTQSSVKMFSQENEQLKAQITRLKSIMDDYTSQDSETVTPTKRFQNKNLAKLKQQYQKFRQEEEYQNKSFEKRYLEVNTQLQEIKLQNDKLRQDLIRQNELYNLKLKMMQQKQEFLQKTLSFTKNDLNQLQKDYEDKQGQILESKRFTEIINDKNKEIETVKNKYQNIVKMLNGQKKRAETNKIQIDSTQKALIPVRLKSRHSLQVKSIVYNHKQNGEMSCSIKTKMAQKSKPKQNLLETIIHSNKGIHKENYQISGLKKRTNVKSPNLQQRFESQNVLKNIKDDQKLKGCGSDLTLLSSHSLELSPQK